jgi:hypothetical protein
MARPNRIKRLFLAALKLISPKVALHGLAVWMPLSTKTERDAIHGRLSEALGLLKIHAPSRYSRVLRSLSGFFIFGADSIRGDYDPQERTCRLAESFVLAPDTNAAAIASTVVHEATHGWLFDRGINYAEPIRHRVEQICIRASLSVARKLPDAEDEIDRCERQLTIEPSFFSNESLFDLDIRRLRETGCPEWFIRAVTWIAKRRAA